MRKVGGSYSVELRPDIVIRFDTPSGPMVILLDAKYRSRGREALSDDEEGNFIIGRSVLSADLHKMHCYVDAIEYAVCSLVVYPGTDFIFYPRDRGLPIATETKEMQSIEGVGAIPILPGDRANQEKFNQAMAKLKEMMRGYMGQGGVQSIQLH